MPAPPSLGIGRKYPPEHSSPRVGVLSRGSDGGPGGCFLVAGTFWLPLILRPLASGNLFTSP